MLETDAITGLRRRTASGVVLYESPRVAAAGAPHAFTTRIGGVSAAPFDSLDLGNPATRPTEGSSESQIAENYRRLQVAIGCEQHQWRRVRQVHGNVVSVAEHQERIKGTPPEADAIVTGRPAAPEGPGVLLCVRVADCVPVLLASRDGRAVAAVHAGWRGVMAGVVPATVRAMGERFGVAPGELVAAIGPCIGLPHFEVGSEVADAFAGAGLGDAVDRSFGAKPHIDLAGAVRMQLVASGVAPAMIDATDRCTYRDRDEFFSHRRDAGRTGRMAAVIAVRP